MSQSLFKKLTYNTLSQITGKVLGTIIGLLVVGMMTRYLGTKGFGQYTTVMAYLQFFGILVDLGLTLTTAQMLAEPKANQEKLMGNILTLRIVSAILILGIAPLVVIFFPYPPIVKLGIAITTLSFFFISLYQIFMGVFQTRLVTEKAALSEVINRVGLLLFTFLAIYYNTGLLGILIAIVLSNFFQFILNYYFALQHISFKWEFDFDVWKQILIKTWPIAITIAFNLLYFKGDTLILSLFQSEEEVGIYGAPYKVLEVLTTFPYLFSGLILPILTKNWATKNMKGFKDIFQKAFDTMSLITIPMIAGTLMLGNQMMILVAGEEFVESGFILKILIFATGIIFIGNIFSHAIVAINKQKDVIFHYVGTALIAVLAYFIFIPKYSILAAAWLTVFSELLISILIFFVVYKETKFTPKLTLWPKLLLAAIVMNGSLWVWQQEVSNATNALNLSLQISLGAIIYFISLVGLKVISKKMIQELMSLKKV